MIKLSNLIKLTPFYLAVAIILVVLPSAQAAKDQFDKAVEGSRFHQPAANERGGNE